DCGLGDWPDFGYFDPGKSLTVADAFRFGCVVGGPPPGLQGHLAVVGREYADDVQRYVAHWGLDRNAAGGSRWLCGRYRPAYGEGSELGQDRDHGTHLQAVLRKLPKLAVY